MLEIIDYLVIGIYFLITFSIAFYYSKRSKKSVDEYFLSGRNLPWYLAGLSLVATTFAADTPLAVTEIVTKNGIAGNWIWWNFAFGGMLTVFFFAKLWRRAGIVTEPEFAEFRYSGQSAKFLRGFKAIYLGLFMNVIILGWVNKAMIFILKTFFNLNDNTALILVFALMVIIAIYSAISGQWGVVVTDAFQFIIAFGGTLILSIFVVNSNEIGGLSGLIEKVPNEMLNVFPTISSETVGLGEALSLSLTAFFAYIGIQWWASWYPGAEPGGGGYSAQRMMSAKNEKHSQLAFLFFQIMHYAIRPWPWILVALATIVIYPDLGFNEKGLGFVFAMRDFLPAGLQGLLLAAFLGAYMSTIATHLNWGASYILNDVYRRFINSDKTDEEYVKFSKIIVFLLMIVSIFTTLFISRISGAWEFIIECGAGVGLVLILRWYWWRINAWSEISAMLTPFVVLPIVKYFEISFPNSLYVLVLATTIVWLLVTYLTSPTEDAVLYKFYNRVKPSPKFWGKYADMDITSTENNSLGRLFFSWILGVLLIYLSIFSVKSFVFLHVEFGLVLLVLGILVVLALNKIMK